MLFPILGQSSLPVVVAQPDERYANRTASVLMTDTEHTTSGSHEKVVRHILVGNSLTQSRKGFFAVSRLR